jgi:hypothetical protein
MGKLLDAHGGIIKTFHTDEMTGVNTIVETQDVEPILNVNKYNQNSGHDGYSKDRTLRHFAEVPFNIIHKWMKEDQLPVHHYFKMPKDEKTKYIQKKMKDPDWQYLRAFWTPTNSRIRHKQG